MSNDKDLMTQLQDLQVEYEKKAKQIGKPAFVELAGECFDACPTLEVIHWTQYTPGFNDGDPCTFSVCGPEFFSKENAVDVEGEPFDPNELRENGGDLHTWEGSDQRYAGKVRLREFEKFLTSELGEDLAKRVFGDDVAVTIYRNGKFEVEEYYCGY